MPRATTTLVAAILSKPVNGIGVVDVSTGEFLITEVGEDEGTAKVVEEILRLQPAECLVPEGMDELAEAIAAACPGDSDAARETEAAALAA